MDWLEIVRQRMKRGNQILFSPGDTPFASACAVIGAAKPSYRRALGAGTCGRSRRGTASVLSGRNTALRGTCRKGVGLWGSERCQVQTCNFMLPCDGQGTVREPKGIALCHAVGQACSTVHTQRHAMGFPIYDLTAIVRDCGVDHCREAVEHRKQEYIERLTAWQHIERVGGGKWADFFAGLTELCPDLFLRCHGWDCFSIPFRCSWGGVLSWKIALFTKKRKLEEKGPCGAAGDMIACGVAADTGACEGFGRTAFVFSESNLSGVAIYRILNF